MITNENSLVEDGEQEAKRISDNTEEGCVGGGECHAVNVQGKCWMEGGTFKDLGLHRRPYALGEQLRNIKKGSKNE